MSSSWPGMTFAFMLFSMRSSRWLELNQAWWSRANQPWGIPGQMFSLTWPWLVVQRGRQVSERDHGRICASTMTHSDTKMYVPESIRLICKPQRPAVWPGKWCMVKPWAMSLVRSSNVFQLYSVFM